EIAPRQSVRVPDDEIVSRLDLRDEMLDGEPAALGVVNLDGMDPFLWRLVGARQGAESYRDVAPWSIDGAIFPPARGFQEPDQLVVQVVLAGHEHLLPGNDPAEHEDDSTLIRILLHQHVILVDDDRHQSAGIRKGFACRLKGVVDHRTVGRTGPE